MTKVTQKIGINIPAHRRNRSFSWKPLLSFLKDRFIQLCFVLLPVPFNGMFSVTTYSTFIKPSSAVEDFIPSGLDSILATFHIWIYFFTFQRVMPEMMQFNKLCLEASCTFQLWKKLLFSLFFPFRGVRAWSELISFPAVPLSTSFHSFLQFFR